MVEIEQPALTIDVAAITDRFRTGFAGLPVQAAPFKRADFQVACHVAIGLADSDTALAIDDFIERYVEPSELALRLGIARLGPDSFVGVTFGVEDCAGMPILTIGAWRPSVTQPQG